MPGAEVGDQAPGIRSEARARRGLQCKRLTQRFRPALQDRTDQILTASSGSYTVNANGNLTARGEDRFVYDQANRLVSATVGGTTTTASYDGDGKRVSTTVGGVTTTYMYDVNTSLPVVLEDGHVTYFYGLGLAYAVDQSNGAVRVFHTDGLGSVRAITNLDPQISVIETYQTDAFGIPTQTQGGISQPFQFTGQQRDASTGLYDLRARMYDPAIGRFLSRDPLAGVSAAPPTLNRFAYAENNPVSSVDPSGLKSQALGMGPCLSTTSWGNLVPGGFIFNSLFCSPFQSGQKKPQQLRQNVMRVTLQISETEEYWGGPIFEVVTGAGVTSSQVIEQLEDLYAAFVPRKARTVASVALNTVVTRIMRIAAAGGVATIQKNVATATFKYNKLTWHFDVDNEAGWNLRS